MVIKVSELLAHNTLVIDDFSPTLGGNLDTAGWEISNTGAPVTISGNDYPFTTGTVGQVLTTDGLGTLTWEDTVVSFSAGTTGFTPLLATTGAVTLAGTLNVASGGTGITTFSSGDILYASAPNVWSTAAPGTTSGVQAWDADLDALAAQSGTGISVRTGAGSWTTRTLVAPAAGITITDPSGVAGNPTFALSNDLAGLEGLTTTGYSVRTGDGTWTTRTITGTSGQIAITNNDGVASNTDIGLATLADSGTGTFLKITRDTFGRVSGTTAVVTDDITTLVNNTYVNITGDTMTGSLIMSGASVQITLPNLPVSPSDAANKAYVDSIAEGLNVLAPTIYVEATGPTATYSNGAAGVGATLTNAGTQIAYTPDGTAATLGQRILVKGYDTGVFGFDTLVGGSGYLTPGLYSGVALTGGTGTGATADITVTGTAVTLVTLVSAGTGYTVGDSLSAADGSVGGRIGGSPFSIPVASLQNAKNGIYTVTTVGSGATNWVLTRAIDFDAPAEIAGGDFSFNQSGATYALTGWVETEVATAIGTSTIIFQQFSGSGSFSAGTGLTLTGTVFSVNLGAGIGQLESNNVGIDLWTPTTGGLILTTDGTTRATSNASKLQLLLPAGSGLTQDATGLYVGPGQITNTVLANSTININTDSGSDPVALGETLLIAGTSVQGISTASTANTVTISASNASSSQKGVASFTASEFVVTSGNVALGLVPVTKGGTGFTSYTVGDILYADTTTSLAKLAIGGANTVLHGGTTPTYSAVSLTADVSGILPALNGGTGTAVAPTSGQFLYSSAGTTYAATTLTGVAVTSFHTSLSGLTPSTPTTGVVTLAGTLGATSGGTGLTALGAANTILGVNAGGSALEYKAITAGTGISVVPTAGVLTINNTGVTSVNVSGGTTGLTTTGGPITSSGTISLTGTLNVTHGGTGLSTTPTDGQLLIGNGTDYTLSTLTAGEGVSVINAPGSITLTAQGGGGGGGMSSVSTPVFDDMIFTTFHEHVAPFVWKPVILNGGIVTASSPVDDGTFFGGLEMTTGITSNSTGLGAIFSCNGIATFLPINLNWQFRIKVPILSGTPAFTVKIGMASSAIAATTNGIYFQYTHSLNSGRWVGTTISSSVSTNVNSTIAVDTDWVRLGVVVNSTNTSVEFFVDGVSIGTSTTNIPAILLSFIAQIQKQAPNTTTSRSLITDFLAASLGSSR